MDAHKISNEANYEWVMKLCLSALGKRDALILLDSVKNTITDKRVEKIKQAINKQFNYENTRLD